MLSTAPPKCTPHLTYHAHSIVDNKSTFTKTGTPRTPDITSDAEFIERQNLFTDFLNSPVPSTNYVNCFCV